MVRSLILALGQLGNRAFRRVLLRSLALTFALFAVAAVGGWFGARAAAASWGGGANTEAIAGAAAVVLTVGGAWLLFRAVAIGVIGVFADDVVAAVEARHYPRAHADARPVGMGRSAVMGAASAARAILVNVAMLPVYVLLIATGVGTPIAFLGVNGWLLGRDLFDMVAVRHVPRDALPQLRRQTRAGRFALGLVAAALFLVPVVNLLAPIVGAAMATHFFHQRRSR